MRPTYNAILWVARKLMGENPKSCLGRVFNFKLGRLQNVYNSYPIQTRPRLDLKTQPKFRSVSLSMHFLIIFINILNHLLILY